MHDPDDFDPPLSPHEQDLYEEILEDQGFYDFIYMQKEVPVSAFETLLGRSATTEEETRILQLQKELGIKDDDALWVIILALQYHLTLYEKIPDWISYSMEGGGKLARYEVKKEIKEQLDSFFSKLHKIEDRSVLNLKNSFNRLNQETQSEIVSMVRKEINKMEKKAEKQSYWSYVWFSVAFWMFAFFGVTLSVAIVNPSFFMRFGG